MVNDSVPSNDYVQLELLNQQLKELDQSIIYARDQMDHAHLAVLMLTALAKANPGDDMLIPLGNSIFAEVKAHNVKTVKFGVGAGVVVDKDLSDATSLMKGQLKELAEYQDQSSRLYDQVIQRALELQDKIEQTQKQNTE